jgi:phage baseplate assembly protein gpV
VLRTRSGTRIEFDDGAGAIRIEDANGNSVALTPAGVIVTAAAKVTVAASQVEISAGSVDVEAGMARFSGVVQCETLTATSVVAASYTPGAGNIW